MRLQSSVGMLFGQVLGVIVMSGPVFGNAGACESIAWDEIIGSWHINRGTSVEVNNKLLPLSQASYSPSDLRFRGFNI